MVGILSNQGVKPLALAMGSMSHRSYIGKKIIINKTGGYLKWH